MARPDTQIGVYAYRSLQEHLGDELRRLDCLLLRRLSLVRKQQQDTDQHSEPGYVSAGEVQWLLTEQDGGSAAAGNAGEQDRVASTARQIDQRVRASEQAGLILPLSNLVRLFGLTRTETGILLICLGPELRRKYDRIYAYLQDDISRKRPSVDLALEVLFDTEPERWENRQFLQAGAPLRRHKLVQVLDDPQSPSGSSGLSQFLQLDERILAYLLGHETLDARLQGKVRVLSPSVTFTDPAILSEPQRMELERILAPFRPAESRGPQELRLVVNFYGNAEYHHQIAALAACHHLGFPLLVMDAGRLRERPEEIEEILDRLLRESLLSQAPVLVTGMDSEAGPEQSGFDRALAAALEEYGWLVFLGGRSPWRPGAKLERLAVRSVLCAMPATAQRRELWHFYLGPESLPEKRACVDRLAQRYVLTADQISAAVTQAKLDLVAGRAETLNFDVLANACRAHSQNSLGALATPVPVKYHWNDLVLPSEIKALLEQICTQVEYRHRVFEDWGFAGKLPYGRGLSVLFSGSPGTGKTMAAQVLANTLQLDLLKIDLSGVVSKYIGETEKHLSEVFRQAESSNAILFFDEADALFGKRTDVGDAHDRYANIEVSYLLQKMEEYDGVVILASNLRNNMDEAFVRRIRFIVEFPSPNRAGRQEIWQKSLPAGAPVDHDIDFAWLAERVKVPGGSIRNIVLNAAFLAARENRAIGMEHMLAGVRSEFQKIGKLWDESTMRYSKTPGYSKAEERSAL